MTDEELEKEATEYASQSQYTDYDNPSLSESLGISRDIKEAYINAAEPREERIAVLDKENGKLEGKLSDLQSEYIELENFKNNEVKGLKDILERVESENVHLIGKLAFTENTLNNYIAQIEELKQLLQDIIVSSGSDREELLKEAEQFLKEDK